MKVVHSCWVPIRSASNGPPHGAEGSSTPGARRLADARLFEGQTRLQPMQILEGAHCLLRFAVGVPDVIHLATVLTKGRNLRWFQGIYLTFRPYFPCIHTFAYGSPTTSYFCRGFQEKNKSKDFLRGWGLSINQRGLSDLAKWDCNM